MKCPECGGLQKYALGMRCGCGYQFALNPKRDGMADGRFLSIVSAASNAGENYFTKAGLYTAYCRRQTRWGLGLGRFFNSLFGPPSATKLETLVRNYESQKGPLERLVRAPGLNSPPPDWSEPDIYDYGVERLLVVQRDLLVDLLVLNNFHVETRTLVISGKGYPAYLDQVAAKCLSDNPELPVYFLHDSTPEGMAWVQPIQSEPSRIPWGEHPKIDLGITPEDVQSLRILRTLRPGKRNNEVKVDALPYAFLAAGLTASFEQHTPFSVLIANQKDPNAVVDTTSFG